MAKMMELANASQTLKAVGHTVSTHPDLSRALTGIAVVDTLIPYNILVLPDSGTIARRFVVGRKMALGLFWPLIVPGIVLLLQLGGGWFTVDTNAIFGCDFPVEIEDSVICLCRHGADVRR